MATYPEIPAGNPPPKKRGWGRRILRVLSRMSLWLMTILLIVIVLWPYMVVTVPTGQVGVLWYRLIGFDQYCWCLVRGTVLDPREVREEGLHLIAPWNRLYLYDLRLESDNQTYNAISKDGVSMTVQINVRFQLQHNAVGVLHKFIGPDYFTTIVSPEIGSQTRQVISQYTAGEVYVSRQAIQDQIRDTSQKILAANLNKLVQPEAMEQPDPRHYNDFLQDAIQILDTLVLSIELPPPIVAAINRQTEQFYQIQEYKFRVVREAEEAKRKQIEANGIAAFQATVSQGISDSYLRWRGIEATLALAQSPNSKIVVIGANKDGLPIILGNVDSPPATAPTTPGAGAPPAAAPAPSDKPAPGTPPKGGSTEAAPTGKHAEGGTPESPDAVATEKAPDLSGGLTLSDISAILSRLGSALHPSAAPPPSTPAAPGTQPKQ
jgi:regulator of protease activity HflC (stomatin/prohibitin superfamily)